MGATPEQYLGWRKRAKSGELYFSEIIEEMPSDQYFAFGCRSCWIFIGNRAMFDKDIDLLDIAFAEIGDHTKHEVVFLLHKVIDVRLRHWDGEHLLVLIQLDGEEEGFVAFEREYPTFIDICQERIAEGKKLPRAITFDRNGKVTKRELIRLTPEDRRPKRRFIVQYDTQGNEIAKFTSVKQTSEVTGLSAKVIRGILERKTIYPDYKLKVEWRDQREK